MSLIVSDSESPARSSPVECSPTSSDIVAIQVSATGTDNPSDLNLETVMSQERVAQFTLEVLLDRLADGHRFDSFEVTIGEIDRDLDKLVLQSGASIFSPSQLHTQQYLFRNVFKIAQALVEHDDWRVLQILAHLCEGCRVRSLRYSAVDLLVRVVVVVLKYQSDHGLDQLNMVSMFSQFLLGQCKDTEPLVRAVVLEGATKVICTYPTVFKPEDYLSVFGIFITDPHRAVRAACVRALAQLFRLDLPELVRQTFAEKYADTLMHVATIDPVASLRAKAVIITQRLYDQRMLESQGDDVLQLVKAIFSEPRDYSQAVRKEAAVLFWKLAPMEELDVASFHDMEDSTVADFKSVMVVFALLKKLTTKFDPGVALALLQTSSKSWKSIYALLMVDLEGVDMALTVDIALALELLSVWAEHSAVNSSKAVPAIIEAAGCLLTRYGNDDRHLTVLIHLVGKLVPTVEVIDAYHELLDRLVDLFVSRPSPDVVRAVGSVLARMTATEQHTEWLRDHIDGLWKQVEELQGTQQVHQLTALCASLPHFPNAQQFKENLCLALGNYIRTGLDAKAPDLEQLGPLVNQFIAASLDPAMVVDMQQVLYVVGAYAVLASANSVEVPKIPDKSNETVASLLDAHAQAGHREELRTLATTIMGLWHFDVISVQLVDTLRQLAAAYGESFPELGSIVSSSQ